jgi:hypothetical protein
MPLAQEIEELVLACNLLIFRKIAALTENKSCMSPSPTPK